MDFYLISLNAVRKVISDSGYEEYAKLTDECIEKWKKEKDCDMFEREFSPTGRFAGFKLEGNKFDNAEKAYWTAQLLVALLSMVSQNAKYYKATGKIMTIRYIREHFGYETEIISGSVCGHCGYREIGAPDVDKYISGRIISQAIVYGLESGDLTDTVESIMNVSNPRIERERKRTQTRIENSKIPYAGTYGKLKKCLLCGSENIKECRYLKSLKANVFVPLGIKK